MAFIILGQEYDWPISLDSEHEYWPPKGTEEKITERNFCFQCQGQPHTTERPEWLAEQLLGNFQENYKAESWKNIGYFFAPSCPGSFAAVSIDFIDPVLTLSSRA